RRTPEALAQMVTKQSRKLLTSLGILSDDELDSRYHVRLERYVKDMLIELHTVREIVDTLVLPASFDYASSLASSAAQAKTAGIKATAQVAAANELNTMIVDLQKHRAAMGKVIDKAEGMHDDLVKQAELLTSAGADTMADVRKCCDALELVVRDDCWPLPKYREMLFPM
ncbi:MAG: glutamine synthetase type III, partial [Gemmatimonadaceae bacterium]